MIRLAVGEGDVEQLDQRESEVRKPVYAVLGVGCDDQQQNLEEYEELRLELVVFEDEDAFLNLVWPEGKQAADPMRRRGNLVRG